LQGELSAKLRESGRTWRLLCAAGSSAESFTRPFLHLGRVGSEEAWRPGHLAVYDCEILADVMPLEPEAPSARLRRCPEDADEVKIRIAPQNRKARKGLLPESFQNPQREKLLGDLGSQRIGRHATSTGNYVT
jgi:hypothetical protein